MRTFNVRHTPCALMLLSGLLAVPAFATPAGPDAIGFDGMLPSLHDVQIENSHVYDYTFTSAPVDWRVQSGVWEMTNRWSCSPGWSWFGGRSEEVAAVWNKRKFAGDFSVQFYFAFKMGMDGPQAKWHYHPGDVAISFCGDGKNLGSGYSFVIGANGNRHSALLKQGKAVVSSDAAEALLPTLVDGNPPTEALHRKWWFAKVNRIGDRIECWLDNKLLFSYNDPQPIDAGHIALWTYNNGIMLSRVQVFYENEVKPDFKLAHSTPLANPAGPKANPANPTKVAYVAPRKGIR
jgi:hypothetical protein